MPPVESRLYGNALRDERDEVVGRSVGKVEVLFGGNRRSGVVPDMTDLFCVAEPEEDRLSHSG